MPDYKIDMNHEVPSIVFGRVDESLAPNGDMVPDSSGAMQFGDPAGSSWRPFVSDPAGSGRGFSGQCGDLHWEDSAATSQRGPEFYSRIVDQGTFRG